MDLPFISIAALLATHISFASPINQDNFNPLAYNISTRVSSDYLDQKRQAELAHFFHTYAGLHVDATQTSFTYYSPDLLMDDYISESSRFQLNQVGFQLGLAFKQFRTELSIDAGGIKKNP